MFIPTCGIAIVNIFIFRFVYESPQFLIEKKKDYKTAKKAFSAYHGVPEDDPSLEEEVRICEGAIKKKRENLSRKESIGGHGALSVMFMPWRANDSASKVIRQNIWAGLAVKIAYVFTRARCLRAYSSFVLYELGGWTIAQANLISLIIGILRVPIALIPVFLVDRIGRRPMILISAFLSLFTLVLMEVAIDIGPSWKMATMISLGVLLLSNASGIGSISRFYCAELVPRSVLLQSVSILTTLEAVVKIGVEFAWYPIANLIRGEAMLMFSIPTTIFLVLMWWLCPETSSKTVNQVLIETAKRKKLDVEFRCIKNEKNGVC